MHVTGQRLPPLLRVTGIWLHLLNEARTYFEKELTSRNLTFVILINELQYSKENPFKAGDPTIP
jgi:hypothetical protein